MFCADSLNYHMSNLIAIILQTYFLDKVVVSFFLSHFNALFLFISYVLLVTLGDVAVVVEGEIEDETD